MRRVYIRRCGVNAIMSVMPVYIVIIAKSRSRYRSFKPSNTNPSSFLRYFSLRRPSSISVFLPFPTPFLFPSLPFYFIIFLSPSVRFVARLFASFSPGSRRCPRSRDPTRCALARAKRASSLTPSQTKATDSLADITPLSSSRQVPSSIADRDIAKARLTRAGARGERDTTPLTDQ